MSFFYRWFPASYVLISWWDHHSSTIQPGEHPLGMFGWLVFPPPKEEMPQKCFQEISSMIPVKEHNITMENHHVSWDQRESQDSDLMSNQNQMFHGQSTIPMAILNSFTSGGFLKWGYLHTIIQISWNFPWNKPRISGMPPLWAPPRSRLYRCLRAIAAASRERGQDMWVDLVEHFLGQMWNFAALLWSSKSIFEILWDPTINHGDTL